MASESGRIGRCFSISVNGKQVEPAELEILEIAGICVETIARQKGLEQQHYEIGKRVLENVGIEGADERILRIMAMSALKYVQELREKRKQQPERPLVELVFEDADHISCRACGFAKELSSLKKTMRELEWELTQKRKKIEKAERNFREAKE